MSQLQLLLQKVLDGVVVMRRDGSVADWNGCAEVIFGWTRAEALGRSMNDLIVPPQHREAHSSGLERYLATGEAHVVDRRIEISALHKSGREFPVELSITEVDYNGEKAFIGFLRDISGRKAAELALRESEGRLAATYNHALVGIGEVGRDGRFLRVNERFEHITGYSVDELAAMTFLELTHPDDVPKDRELFEKQWSGEVDNYTQEKRYVRKDGGIVWVELAASIVRGGDGARSFGVRIVGDISERKEAEKYQRLLLDELNHRVKNTLTVVQGIAQQTFRGDSVPPEMTSTFQGRLTALATAHDLLIRQKWSQTPIRRLIEQALRPFGGQKNAFALTGEEVLLSAETSLTLVLAMHELATNAFKYGALSAPEGQVAVEWSVSDGKLRLVWTESGGPPVAPPESRGFGTRLLEQALAREMSGTVGIDFRVEGVVCIIEAPLSQPAERADRGD